MRLRRLRLLTTTLLTVMALVVAGCAGDPDADTDATDEAPVGEVEDTTAPEETTAPDDTDTTEAETDATDATDGEEPSGELDQVRFAPTAPLPIYWPYYYVAESLGFYEDEGIDIEIINAQTAVQQSLLAGQLDITGTGLDYIPQAPTLDDPPKWYMNVDRYLWVMVTLEDSDIQTAADLEGGTIGINEPHDTLDADFLMGAAGVEMGNYELLPVGSDQAQLVALENGEVDAFVTAGAVSVAALRDVSDTPIRVIENEAAESYYNVGNMATLEELEDPDIAVRFGRAVARGMVWTWENPEATGRLVYEAYPESAESEEQAIILVEAGNEANRASYEARGAMELEVYQDMVDKHVEVGLIEEGYDADILFTNDLIDQIWDFDVEAEAEAARNYTG
jgi:NitT/TauT family transport system substrate-binding protein